MAHAPFSRFAGIPVVIETKLAPPSPSTPWLERARLIDLLVADDTPRATLLCAPAGYGKTVLMSQAYAQLTDRHEKTAWASFDRHDATPFHFLLYVMAAVRRACPGFGAPFFSLLAQGGESDVNFFLDVALKEIATLNEQVWIFLDDLDQAASPALPDLLEALIRYSSMSVRYVLCARDSRYLSFWQLRAERRLQVIDASALAFSEGEAHEYLSKHSGQALEPATIDALTHATEGWGMGLQLARLAMAKPGAQQAIAGALSGRQRDVSGYLLHNVLAAQPPDVCEFLLKTSILGRLCAENCNALTGATHGQAMLTRLEQANLFVQGLDAQGTWYRYHHLFQEFLQQQLQLTRADEIAALRSRASLWFRDHQLAEEALELARATGDTAFLAATLDAICGTLAYTGNHSAFRNAIDAIEEAVLVRYPRLALDQVWIELMNWNFLAARHLLEQVEESLHGNPHGGAGAFEETLLHRRLMLAFHSGEFMKAARLSEQWLARYPRGEHYVVGSAYVVLLMSRSYLLDTAGVAIAARQAESLYRHAQRRNGMVWHNCIIGLTHEACGALGPALQAYTDALALSKGLVGAPPGVLAMPAIFTAQIYYEQNELDRAQWLIDAHPASANPGGLIDYVVAYVLTRSKLHAAAGQADDALRALQDGIDLARAHRLPRIAQLFEGERVRQELALGRLADAREHAARAGVVGIAAGMTSAAGTTGDGPAEPAPGVTVWDTADVVTWARMMLANGQHRQTPSLLKRWMDYCAARNVHRQAIVFALLLARARVLEGDTAAALRVLAHAVKKGAELGIVRTFVDEGTVIRGLLIKLYESKAALDATEKVYVRTLLRAFGSHDAPPGEPVASASTGGAAHTPLSGRELEILALISQGIKSSFVGSRLGISEGTVKWHLQHVFQKLGVRNRREAIARARALGIFEA
ncbi:LuxR C-terminal-related transcriptional regulator [Paraburkholderia sp. J63]|uniref:LuxR C-terminal-related transcriptional regulator n=1 Tax=Paraburkholderia sp. J63 TaxID=2805434 RepID=UPI002ABE4448|nr:LuxR C-terminal-related transcriptional regulator [Paraburkholderia sp. J63]